MENNKKNVKALSEKTAATTLQETNLSWAGKIFFAGLAFYLAGAGMQKFSTTTTPIPKLPFRIRGTPAQIEAIISMILASKTFQQELNRPGATVQSVIKKLNLQNMTKEKFKQITGKKWPL